MRPTTKDLAKEANVSLATVDRVLNNRAGVQQRTIDRVNKAIEKIGFVRNVSAANLARSKSYRLLFLLPESGDQFHAQILARIEEANAAFASDMISARIRSIPVDGPQETAEILGRIHPGEAEGIAIMAPESPQVRDAMIRVSERGLGTVSLASGHPSEVGGAFVGIDNRAAGATAGRLMGRFIGGRTGKVIVITETMHSRDSLERRNGFDAVLTSDFPNIQALPTLETRGDPARAETIVKRSIGSHPDIAGVYVLSSEARVPLKAVSQCVDKSKTVVIAHERTPFTEQALREHLVDAVIAQNPGRLVNSSIQLLRAMSDNRDAILPQDSVPIEILVEENL